MRSPKSVHLPRSCYGGRKVRRPKSKSEQDKPAGRIGSFKLEGVQMRRQFAGNSRLHVLEGGFIDARSGFIRGYRETTTGKFCLNYKHNSDWFCPGSMAKFAFQLLLFADDLGAILARRADADAWPCVCRVDPEQNVEPVPMAGFRAGRPRAKLPQVARRLPGSFWQTWPTDCSSCSSRRR